MVRQNSNSQILIDEIIIQNFEDQNDYTDKDSFFELFSVDCFLKQYDVSNDEIETGIIGDTLDGGCDSLYVFLNSELINLDDDTLVDNTIKQELKKKKGKNLEIELFIIQSKNNYSFNETVINKWKTFSKNLLDISNDKEFENRYLQTLIHRTKNFKKIYQKLISKSPKLLIEFVYISKGEEVHPNVLEQANELKQEISCIFPSSRTSTSITFIGAKELMAKYDEPLHTPFLLEFQGAPITGNGEREYIGLVNLYNYYKLISDSKTGRLIKHIFESNVRDYQGSVTVNKDIRDTLEMNNSEDFWWMNNGITIIASEIDKKTNSTISIENPAIVNGLQTSREIYNYFSDLQEDDAKTDTRNVMVKIIVPADQISRDKIILATNNQTSIPKASLRGNDNIHRQIEHYFSSRDYYYDRRKNYYKNEGKKSHEIISLSFLSQCLFSIILGKPNDARARPSTLLNNEATYNKVYSENTKLDVFYNAASLGKKVQETLRKGSKYSRSEQSDIMFYVVYLVCVRTINDFTISKTKLGGIDVSSITEEFILETADIVFKSYKKLGGDNKVAKGSQLISTLQNKRNITTKL